MRDVVILGSTGSIGVQALEIIDANPGQFRVVALTAAGNNIDLLVPFLIECFQGAKLFNLFGREFRKIFQQDLHGCISSNCASVDARGPEQR